MRGQDGAADCARHAAHPLQVSLWKRKAGEGLAEQFERGRSGELQALDAQLRKLHKKTGQPVMDRGFLKSEWY